jgi:hypothetical protein
VILNSRVSRIYIACDPWADGYHCGPRQQLFCPKAKLDGDK